MQELKSEDRIQQDCYIWYHNTYPDMRGMLCYNLNNSRNKVAGARNKSMGLQAGRSDLTLYANGTAYFIEMKTETGEQSAVQKLWQAKAEKNGFTYVIIRSLDEFKQFIDVVKQKPGYVTIKDVKSFNKA